MSSTMVSYMEEMSKVLKSAPGSTSKAPRIRRVSVRRTVCLATVVVAGAAVALRSEPRGGGGVVAPRVARRNTTRDQEETENVAAYFHDVVVADPLWRAEPAQSQTRRAASALEESAQRFRRALRRKPVRTDDFLAGVDNMMPAFAALGSAIHAAAQKDVIGNTHKLRRNGAPAVVLVALLERDYESGNQFHPDSSVQATTWLVRILEFAVSFFERLLENRRAPLSTCLANAYERTLGAHHNVVMRSVAIALMQIIPDRESMVSCFRLASFDDLAPVLKKWNAAARPVINRLKAHLDKLADLYPTIPTEFLYLPIPPLALPPPPETSPSLPNLPFP
mmetsp:Transcript_19249/g.60546  ORF Transcript_19249/g.60546 Transcript_19249/m.60546 type:complete len:336 (-) Transcript_19249:490-1497(-)